MSLPPQRHQIMAGISEPKNVDVLVGRGTIINQHEGNIMLRTIVDHHRKNYGRIVKLQREHLSKSTVSFVRSLGGRFLERDKSCGLWFEVGDDRAIEKVMRSFTDRFRSVNRRKNSLIKNQKKGRENHADVTSQNVCLRAGLTRQSGLPNKSTSLQKSTITSERNKSAEKCRILSPQIEEYHPKKVTLSNPHGSYRGFFSGIEQKKHTTITVSTVLSSCDDGTRTDIMKGSILYAESEYVDVVGNW